MASNTWHRLLGIVKLSPAFVLHVYRRYQSDDCSQRAAALTYTTLFALVPLLTLMYAMFSLIPSFQGIGGQFEHLLFTNLVPSSGLEVQNYLRDFSRQARNLGAVGGLVLIVTSWLMLTAMETAFNRIWGVTENRRGLSGFLLYWGVLSFGPLLVGVGLLIHAYVLSVKFIADGALLPGMSMLNYLPWLMTWVAFTLIYAAMPNCPVSRRDAAIGGLLTAVFFELAKALFGKMVANSDYHTVYGAFAAVPLLLLWIYLSWSIVLAGAELVRSLETFSASYHGHRFPDLLAMLAVCRECLLRQQTGGALTDKDIVRMHIDSAQWRHLRSLLLRAKILVTTEAGSYVFARDPRRTTLWQLMELCPDGGLTQVPKQSPEAAKRPQWRLRAETLITDTRADVQSRLAVPLDTLLNDGHPTTAGAVSSDPEVIAEKRNVKAIADKKELAGDRT